MAPKIGERKVATKMPAGKTPMDKKEAGKRMSADKKRKSKSRKETYSSYIYKGRGGGEDWGDVCSAEAGASGHGDIEQGDVYSEQLCERHL
ncbi:hypothetical protein PMAC_003367 [Pneumocystis sp. 'macacae']|nr:hypothetical protein PMAC_003367 [Pneumocystis sp. 'macacae']